MIEIPEEIKQQIENTHQKCHRIKPCTAIYSLAYNHGSYIRKTLEGFIRQQTDFPFVAIVHDDASTDNTAEILKEYADKYPDIILPIFETENQYSRGNGILSSIMESAIEATGAEYVAFCECDDYWTDLLKLQKQVDFLRLHPDYGMTFHNVDYYDQNRQVLKRRGSNYLRSCKVSSKDIIIGDGGFCPTCSIVYRVSLIKDYPSFAKTYHVGDYPLQLFFAIVSKVYYFNSRMAVYRINQPSSWTINNSVSNVGKRKGLRILCASIQFLHKYDEFSNFKYSKTFKKRIKRNKYDYYFGVKEYAKALTYLPGNFYEICRYLSCVLHLYKVAARIKRIFYEK